MNRVAVATLLAAALGCGCTKDASPEEHAMSRPNPTAELLRRLEDPSTGIDEKIAAAGALGATKDVSALEPLARLSEVTHEELRRAVVEAMTALGGAEVFARRLGDPKATDPSRLLAAQALRHLKEPTSVAALTRCLRDANPKVRARCAHALAVFGAEGARASLVDALEDQSTEVRYFAVLALEQVEGAAVAAALRDRRAVEQDATVRGELERVLGAR